MKALQVPSKLYKQVTSRMAEIEKAYSDFVVTDLPAGYDGEISEAYNNLIVANLEITADNILLYLKAKANLMKYFKTDGADLTEIYRKRIEKPSVAGVIIPEWVLSLKVLLWILLKGLAIVYLLEKIYGSKVPPRRISECARTIVNMQDVKQLTVIASEVTRPKIRKKR